MPGNLCITRNPWSRLITESRQGSLVAALGFLSHSAMAPWSRWPGLLDCASQGCLVSPGSFFLLDQTYSLKDPCTFSKLILSVSTSACLLQNPDQLKCQFCAKHLELLFNFQLITSIKLFSMIINITVFTTFKYFGFFL